MTSHTSATWRPYSIVDHVAGAGRTLRAPPLDGALEAGRRVEDEPGRASGATVAGVEPALGARPLGHPGPVLGVRLGGVRRDRGSVMSASLTDPADRVGCGAVGTGH